MMVCCRCRLEMQCDKNGVGADFGYGHVYAADRYKCPECGMAILKTNEVACFDPEHRYMVEYLEMNRRPLQEVR